MVEHHQMKKCSFLSHFNIKCQHIEMTLTNFCILKFSGRVMPIVIQSAFHFVDKYFYTCCKLLPVGRNC